MPQAVPRDIAITCNFLNDRLCRGTASYSNLGYTPGLRYEYEPASYQRSSPDSVIHMEVYSDSGNFVNLGGLLVNTESFQVAAGLHPINDTYIGVYDYRTLLNKAFWDSEKNQLELSDEDYLYILEELKVNFNKLDFYTLLRGQVGGYTGVSSRSVVKTLVDRTRLSQVKASVMAYVKKRGNEEIWRTLLENTVLLLNYLDRLSRAFYCAFITEDSVKDVVAYIKNFEFSKISSMGNSSSYAEKLNLLYIGHDLPPMLLQAMFSYGFLSNKRKDLLTKIFEKLSLGQAYSSTGLYGNFSPPRRDINGDRHFVDGPLLKVWFGFLGSNSQAYGELPAKFEDSIVAYNFISLMRSINWDQDLFFAAMVDKLVSKDLLLSNLVNRFQMGEALDMSHNALMDYCMSYSRTQCILEDCGSTYSRTVKIHQNGFTVFSPVMLQDAGRVFEKASSRILRGFTKVTEGSSKGSPSSNPTAGG